MPTAKPTMRSSGSGGETSKSPGSPLTGHAPALDGLRFFSFLGVFLWHAWQGNRLAVFAHYGALGVQVFFVLSGFLIGGILLEVRKEHDVPLSRRLFTFYVRRALRIFPLYYLALLIVAVLPAFGVTALGGRESFVWNATYLSNVASYLGRLQSGGLAHLWSLSVEEHFYFLAPIAILMLTPTRLAASFVGLWLVCAVGRLYFSLHGTETTELLSPFQFDCLTIGIAAAVVKAKGTFLGLDQRRLRQLSLACGIALLPLFVLRHAESKLTVAIAHMIEQWVFSVACAGLILDLWKKPDSRVARFLALPPLRGLGEITYGLYVFHLPCLVLMSAWLSPYMQHGTSLPGLVLTIGLSMISFRFFERPINALKSRFPYGAATNRGPQLKDQVAKVAAGT